MSHRWWTLAPLDHAVHVLAAGWLAGLLRGEVMDEGGLVARLTAVRQSLEMVNQHVDELLRQAAAPRATKALGVSELRSVGHRLVVLAGDLTTLGVDAARWADELDEAMNNDDNA